jgi:hypothetical protein
LADGRARPDGLALALLGFGFAFVTRGLLFVVITRGSDARGSSGTGIRKVRQ